MSIPIRRYTAASPGVTPQNGQMITVAVDEATYGHRGLTNGTAQYYVVAAVLSGVIGPASPEVSATPAGEWALEVQTSAAL